jgi:hypothetical protein
VRERVRGSKRVRGERESGCEKKRRTREVVRGRGEREWKRMKREVVRGRERV